MNKIAWVTPFVFMDNNQEVVPYLSKFFNIHWIIIASQMPSNADDIKKLESPSLKIEYYVDGTKWYNPLRFFSAKKFFNHVKEQNCDVIYYNNAPQLWDYYAAKFVVSHTQIIFALHNAKIPKGARHESMARYYMNKVIRNYKNFHVFSENQKEYLESVSEGKNILYAPLPLINFGKKQERQEFKDKINFLAFGYIRRYKRFDLLIEAAEMLYEETDIPFVVSIVGKCNDWSQYERLIKHPELFNLRIGFVDDKEVPGLFSNCDYLVQPYQDLAQSGPLMLAFNYNVPIIASDIPSFKEFITEGKTGYFFKSEDAKSLKEVMKSLLSKKEDERISTIARMKSFVDQNYSMESLSKRYRNYFSQL